MKFEEYFSFEAIVGDLIRWRVNGKGTRDENGRRERRQWGMRAQQVAPLPAAGM